MFLFLVKAPNITHRVIPQGPLPACAGAELLFTTTLELNFGNHHAQGERRVSPRCHCPPPLFIHNYDSGPWPCRHCWETIFYWQTIPGNYPLVAIETHKIVSVGQSHVERDLDPCAYICKPSVTILCANSMISLHGLSSTAEPLADICSRSYPTVYSTVLLSEYYFTELAQNSI
jgi:hypothetical protein